MYYKGGQLFYDDVSPSAVRADSPKRQAARVAQYLVERFRPTLMLDIGCHRPEMLASVLTSGVDVYGLREDTKFIFLDDEFPHARVSLFDLGVDYWKSPTKFDLIWTTSAMDHVDRSAEHLLDTVTCNLKRGGFLVLAPPPDKERASSTWSELWRERLERTGFELLNEETEKIRRLTHRVGQAGTELVFRRSA
jgi:SAM-dependent methyltransferase